MSHKYFYDDSGLPSSYLLLSILLPITIFSTYKYTQTKRRVSCKCTSCLKHKKAKQSFWGIILLALLWTLVSYLTKNVLTIKHQSKGYNPYQVLGLEPECTKTQVKSAFRKLALKSDPDKFQEEEKKKAENRLRELVKAYNMINEGIKIDTEASVELMAIPDWLIGKGTFILICYGILLGIFLPRYAFLKYKSTNQKNRFNVFYKTTDSFYKGIINKEEKYEIRSLLHFVTESSDFKNHSWKKSINIKSLVEEKFGYPLKDGDTGYFVLMDHLFRTERGDPLDLHFAQTKALQIIQGMKEVARMKKSDSLLEKLFILERMVVQAVFDEEYFEMQKGISFEEIFLKKKQKKGIEKKEFIFPEIKVSEIKAFVEQTAIQEEASVFKDGCFILPEDSKVTLSFKVKLEGPDLVHAPFLKEDVFTVWSIFLLVDNKLVEEHKEVKEREKLIKFSLEGRSKPLQVKILFRNGGYFGVDKEEVVSLRFVK